jgi:hypothetical protein
MSDRADNNELPKQDTVNWNSQAFEGAWRRPVPSTRQEVGLDATGLISLNTGDKLLRLKGSEVLVMPDGGTLEVKKDGSYELTSKTATAVKYDATTRTTTLDMGKGQTIKIKDGSIAEVQRDGKVSSMVLPERLSDAERELLRSIERLRDQQYGRPRYWFGDQYMPGTKKGPSDTIRCHPPSGGLPQIELDMNSSRSQDKSK